MSSDTVSTAARDSIAGALTTPVLPAGSLQPDRRIRNKKPTTVVNGKDALVNLRLRPGQGFELTRR